MRASLRPHNLDEMFSEVGGAKGRDDMADRHWLAICIPFAIFAVSPAEALANGAFALPNGGLGMPLCERIWLRGQKCAAGPLPNSWLCEPYHPRLAPQPPWLAFSFDIAARACLIRDVEIGDYFCKSIRWMTDVKSLSWIAYIPQSWTTLPHCFGYLRVQDIRFSPGNTF
jgi:hypothetical protein